MNEKDSEVAHLGHGINTSKSHLQPRQFDNSPWTRRALTTNRIAERAGVSIGTLYQYFANKEAILIEMARAQLESDRIAITRVLSKSISEAPAEPERLAMLQLRDGLSTCFQKEGRASAF